MFLDNPWRHNLLKNVNIAKPFHRKICTTIFVTRFAHKLTLKWKKSLLLLFSVGGSSMPPQSVKIVSISRYQYHQWRCLNSKEYWEKYGNFYSPLSYYASYKKRKKWYTRMHIFETFPHKCLNMNSHDAQACFIRYSQIRKLTLNFLLCNKCATLICICQYPRPFIRS